MYLFKSQYHYRKDQNMTFKQTSFTPREIVSELDRFIIGQEKAKKAAEYEDRTRDLQIMRLTRCQLR